MKRQMKMTTTQKPQKKFLGGKILKKVSDVVKRDTMRPTSIEEFRKTSTDASEKIKADKEAMASQAAKSSGGKGILRALAPAAKGLRGIGRAIRGRGKALSKVGGMMSGATGMKKGGSVMSDKMGRAMKKKTADARGRAMKGK